MRFVRKGSCVGVHGSMRRCRERIREIVKREYFRNYTCDGGWM